MTFSIIVIVLLLAILAGQGLILKRGSAMKQVADEIKAAVDALVVKFDAATDEVAKDLKDLRDFIAGQVSGGLTTEEASELKAELETKFGTAISRLEVLGQDPTNPVPPEA